MARDREWEGVRCITPGSVGAASRAAHRQRANADARLFQHNDTAAQQRLLNAWEIGPKQRKLSSRFPLGPAPEQDHGRAILVS